MGQTGQVIVDLGGVVQAAEEEHDAPPHLLVRIHFIIVMIRWTGLAPWEFEFPFPGSLTSTFLQDLGGVVQAAEEEHDAPPHLQREFFIGPNPLYHRDD